MSLYVSHPVLILLLLWCEKQVHEVPVEVIFIGGADGFGRGLTKSRGWLGWIIVKVLILRGTLDFDGVYWE